MSASPHFVQAARTASVIAAASFSDSADITSPTFRDEEHKTQAWCEGFRVTTAGTIKVSTWNGDAVSLVVLDGEYVPLKVTRFWTTGTSGVTAVTCYWP
jgi:hypothetical protein